MSRTIRFGSTGVLVVLALLALSISPCLAGKDLPQYTPNANDTRSDVPDIYKWNLGQLFKSDGKWEKELNTLTKDLNELVPFAGKLEDPKALKECLDLYFGLHDRASHVQQYASLKLDTELTNQNFNSMQQRSLDLMDKLMATSGFIRSEALALSDEQMSAAYNHKKGPAQYRDYLDNMRRRVSRILHPGAERVMQLAGDNLWAEIDLNEIPSSLESTFGALLSDIQWPIIKDADGKEVQMTLSNYGQFRSSSDRRVRRDAIAAFFATLRQFQHTFAATLGGQFKLDVTYSRARHYDTALEAYLDKDGLKPAVVENLINTVNANLEPLHKYVELRKKALGYDDLHIYDLYIPFVEAAESEYTFADAREILPKALKPLGKDYNKILKEGLDPKTGWLDLYPSNDKDSGAYSASVYGRYPYVKMNYQDSLDDMSTLAHEYGHALHSYLAMGNQPYHNYRYVPFLAEIASTCNEALLADYLIQNVKSKEEKAALLVAQLESIRQTIYRQTLFTEFERAVHGYVEVNTPITARLLDETYRSLISKYYGPGFTIDENDGMEWAYIPHFYYKYYVYSYATGLSSGIAIAERVKELGEPAVEGYLNMLKGGCSDAPLDLLKKAGVDLTKPDAIQAAMTRFATTISELETLLD